MNARDAVWLQLDARGSRCDFESEEHAFSQLGFALHVLEPGVPAGLYHAESQQEAFLVLAGECRLLVEVVERLLGPWDFFHFPAAVSEVAARYGASVDVETSDPDRAYARFELGRWERPPSWNTLPWA